MHYTRIRDLREDADLTQEQLVKILGMHKTTYTNYEQGKREPPFDFIIKLAKFYNVFGYTVTCMAVRLYLLGRRFRR